MVKIKKLVVGQLATNCYLVFSDNQVLIIDPGDDADDIVNKIKDLNLTPIAILATHGHFDHILAATELKLAFKIPLYLYRNDLPILTRTQTTTKFFTGLEGDPPPIVDKFLQDGQLLPLGKEKLKVVHTPGHTPGSISLVGKKMVFVGDLVFAGGGRGRTDLAGGDEELLDKSIKKIIKLPEETVIFPGHGEETTIKEERRFFKS